MKQKVTNIYYSFPIQLFILHFRKYQILLLFWFILFNIINSSLLQNFGSDALFLAPEYLGKVSIKASIITGISLGIYVMSWNITTFILHSKRFHFLATSDKPFLKYCINNALLPIIFLIFYFYKLFRFNDYRELMSDVKILSIISGIAIGFLILTSISFAYFFTADRKIIRSIAPIITDSKMFQKTYLNHQFLSNKYGLKVVSYLGTSLRLRHVRHIEHYSREFIEMVFKRHHIAAIISVGLSFLFLVFVGFMQEYSLFELPAAASFFIFLAIMTAVIGALTYFLQSWSLPAIILMIITLNILLEKEIVDPRNKAYGLNYSKDNNRTPYNKKSLLAISTPQQISADKDNMIGVLNQWKQKQSEDKPVMVFIDVSGGGLRSAAFVMNALQQLDSSTSGALMKKTFLISGASGGMLAATYYREIYRRHLSDSSIKLYSSTYTDNISEDLLNPVFSSMIARDIFAPVQKFSISGNDYLKDRGYAFEQKLSRNTKGMLNIQLKDIAKDEASARIPLIFFTPVVKSDGRKLIISSLPVSFMMKPSTFDNDINFSPDAIDFSSFFRNVDPGNLRILTALRMNATFPYVLPSVWLPSNPILDVVDAGIRDNYGQETTLRFIDQFKDWIKENTGGVVILQFRDKVTDNWEQPFVSKSVTDMILGPATILEHNWFKLQDYSQADNYNYYRSDNDSTIQRVIIMYKPEDADKTARLCFHLTTREKNDVIRAYSIPENSVAINKIYQLLKH